MSNHLTKKHFISIQLLATVAVYMASIKGPITDSVVACVYGIIYILTIEFSYPITFKIV